MLSLQKMLRHSDLMIGFAILTVVGMLIIPLPGWVLDVGMVTALAAGIMILLTSVNVKEPLQFSVFPSLLVVMTLFRLALSIAATKLILGHGEGGAVIKTFGEFVLGGNFVVGFVAFLILMVVQFLVITNGATRVSEVVARFTLDAMPGKQMAIDADLAAGLIDEEQARERRKAIKQEADFYGSMDGASKFVKGEAIASILIVVINLIGGITIGMIGGQGDLATVAQTYAVLTVGEGLISQIPALLIATSAGLLVTRNGQETGMGGTLFGQLLGQPRVLMTSGGAIALIGLLPGFPPLIFFGIGAALFGLSRFATRNPEQISNLGKPDKPKEEAPKVAAAGPAPGSPDAVLPLLSVDALEIEIGYGLTRLADTRVGGDLPERISATRTQIATDLGFVMPTVRVRDNATLDPNEYVIKVRGEEVARAIALPDHLMAILPGPDTNGLPGSLTTEPVFGLPAVWIEPIHRDQADINGCTLVEPSSMIVTHLSEIVKRHAAELLSRQDVAKLIDNIKETHEALVRDLIPDIANLGDVQKILQHLLRERVPIRDLVTILETMADYAPRVKDHDQLGELVRASIARTISRQFGDARGRLTCLTMNATLERTLQECVHQTAGGVVLSLDAQTQHAFAQDLQTTLERATAEGHNPVLLCSSTVRLPLKRLVDRLMPGMTVLAYNEISAQADVEFVGQVQAAGATGASAA